MSIFFNYNGKYFEEGTSVINPDNRGLRYGDGLFETMKAVNGKIKFAAEHFARLAKGMKVLQFEIHTHFTAKYLEKQIYQLLQKNHHTASARIRLTVIRGNGGLYDAKNHHPNYIIQSWPLSDMIGDLNNNGLVLGIYGDVRKNVDILSNIKHNNYLLYVLAALAAKKNKWNDAVILNNPGRVCETTIANIFLVKNKIIYTPALSEGCVAGVYRHHLISEFKRRDISFAEKEISVDDLLDADECFVTNSIGNIRWVKNIGDKEFTNVKIQELYNMLQ